MKFLVYSEVTAHRIGASLGQSEYSYYFVLKEFLPVLESLGTVTVIENPKVEVDALYARSKADGEPCVFLSFAPPHKTELKLRCPTVPVLAWEFDTIPSEAWLGDRQQDWRVALKRCGRAITHCGLTVEAILAVMGPDYPVTSIPAPIWDKYAPLRERGTLAQAISRTSIRIKSGVVLDTHDVSLAPYMPDQQSVASAVALARKQEAAEQKATALPKSRDESLLRITYRYFLEWRKLVGGDLFQEWMLSSKRWLMRKPQVAPLALKPVMASTLPIWQLSEHTLELTGVVFTALFNPYDGRKNWVDMLTAFCAAFRDKPDATLVFKLGHAEYQSAMNDILMCMARLPKFQCRVVLVQGFLEGKDFDALIEATSFVVNASHGEGQCLPLMEFLSCGRPAVSPRHSAMVDYIDTEVAFVVDSWLDATAWSHDARKAFRTCRHQINWESLVDAYRAAYCCITQTPERYAQMSHNAVERMRKHCSRAAATERLRHFLNLEETSMP
ncbi:MAG: glycosyltransferase involved in cell wall biosynthesis [Pseudomonas sp.]|jgi:glycosyltransferase involved in cell wall biosynthesis